MTDEVSWAHLLFPVEEQVDTHAVLEHSMLLHRANAASPARGMGKTPSA
jgi:hypothetical protein